MTHKPRFVPPIKVLFGTLGVATSDSVVRRRAEMVFRDDNSDRSCTAHLHDLGRVRL